MAFHIMAIHGAGMGPGIWGGMMPVALGREQTGLFHAVSLPGHNTGDAPNALLHSVEAMAAWLAGRIDDAAAAQPDMPVILLGHSLGAAVALQAAAHPHVAGVVALGIGPRLPVNADLLADAQNNLPAAQGAILKWGISRDHGQRGAVTDMATEIFLATPPAALAVDLAACDRWRAPPFPGKPLLVIAGEHDRMTPLEGAHILAESWQGELVILPGGHMLPIEYPVQATRAMADFLARI